MHSFFINFKRKEDFIYIFNTFYMDYAPNNILYYLYTSFFPKLCTKIKTNFTWHSIKYRYFMELKDLPRTLRYSKHTTIFVCHKCKFF